ncbi:MAG: hypothetical protein M9898_02145 [Chitinophagaceae bacterium]|nr:hypothetical protein [Chitinophagaceae bacterium]
MRKLALTDVLIPHPLSELVVKAVSIYFKISRKDLITSKKARSREHVRQKDMLYYLLKEELQLAPLEIAVFCKTSRQNVDRAVLKTEAEINIYLQSTCDYKNLKELFQTLRVEQEKLWQTSRKNNTKPLIKR